MANSIQSDEAAMISPKIRASRLPSLFTRPNARTTNATLTNLTSDQKFEEAFLY